MTVYVIQVQLFNDDKKCENLFKCGYTENINERVKGVVKELNAAGYKEARARVWLCLPEACKYHESSLLDETEEYQKLVEKRFPGTYFTEYRKYDARYKLKKWFEYREEEWDYRLFVWPSAADMSALPRFLG